ncbi:carbohydrate ABC transporter permease [Defluviitalea raffinosedens]|nr:sugar ABC transporter permease [Defluviitalea raffinosedens]MBM7686564.1 multiple sugar transport system permease protein [Defluviitalea raffinosedens]
MLKNQKMDWPFLFILPSLLGFLLFYICPFLTSLRYVFVDKPVNGNFVGMQNFIDLFQSKSYLNGLKNTLIFMGISIPVNIVLSLRISLMIHKMTGQKELFTLLFLIPLVIPSGSMLYFWKMLFDYNGYVNNLLFRIGIDNVNWLGTSLARYVMIGVFVWKSLGYNIVLFLSGLSSIPKEYYAAAKVDGASEIQEFFKITLVHLLPTLIVIVILSIIDSFKIFKEIYLIAGNYPHDSIYTLQHFMNNMFHSLNYQKLTTATCVLVLAITMSTQILFKLEKKVR